MEPLIYLGVGYVAGAVTFAGLWWGERGRNRDLRFLTGLRSKPARAKAFTAEGEPVEDAPPEEPYITPENRAQMVEDFMREAQCSRKVAEEEVEKVIRGMYGVGV